MKRQWLINIGLVLGSLTLFVGGIEVFLRVTHLETTAESGPRIYQNSADPRIGYELIPNNQEEAYRATVTSNSLGFRGPEIPEGKPLVAVLGDSMSFGYGTEDDESLPAQLQKYFPDHHFLNTALPGYNLKQESAVYETKVRSLEPKAVLIGFFYNDLEMEKPYFVDDQGILRPSDWTPEKAVCDPKISVGALGFIPGSCWLNDHSTLFIKLRKVASTLSAHRAVAARRKESQQHPAEDEFTDEALTEYENDLDRLAAMLAPEQIRIFIVIPDSVPHPEATPQIIRMAKERGFFVVDLHEKFGTEAKTLGWDLHPHPDAIEEAADYIAEKLRESGILK